MTASPTLRQDSSYLSVLAQVPAALQKRVVDWRLAQGVTPSPAQLSCHLTVLIAPDSPQPLPALARALAGQTGVEVELGEPASFAPVTPVSYLPLTRGGEGLETLHQLAAAALGGSASPFPYAPHLTLANHLPQQQLEASLKDFRGLDPELTRFRVDLLKVYRYRAENWEHLGDLGLEG